MPVSVGHGRTGGPGRLSHTVGITTWVRNFYKRKKYLFSAHLTGYMRNAPLIALLLIAITARAQEKESFYVFNADWQPTKIDSAHFLLHIHQMNDTCWQFDYYNFTGPLLKSEQYGDKDGKQLNGLTRLYNDKGLLDSAAAYKRGLLNGDAYKLSGDTFHIKMKYIYRNDSLISTIDPAAEKEDKTKYPDEKESEYPGGTGQWLRYMNKHLRYPDRAVSQKTEGEVRVLFIVDPRGGILDPYIGKSVEYSLDQESLRIVRESGKWEPGFQNGKNVKTYKCQPVVFRLE